MEQNSLLKDLARQREERSCSNSSQKRQRQATGTSDSGGGSSGSSGVASGGVGGGTGGGGTGGGRLASSAVLAPAIVDLCGSDDEATEDPSLALARRLQAEEDQHQSRLHSPGASGQASSSEPWPGIDDEALAERLQREEMAKVTGPLTLTLTLSLALTLPLPLSLALTLTLSLNPSPNPNQVEAIVSLGGSAREGQG